MKIWYFLSLSQIVVKGKLLFSCNDGILNVDLNRHQWYDPENVIYIRLLACHVQYEKHKGLKNELNEELILIA